MSFVDTRSPELAYTSKPNILHPGSAAQKAAAATTAAARAADKVTPNDPGTKSTSGAVLTDTKAVN